MILPGRELRDLGLEALRLLEARALCAAGASDFDLHRLNHIIQYYTIIFYTILYYVILFLYYSIM